jgi:arylsulfatase
VRAEKPSLPVQAPDFIRHEVHPKQTREGWPVLGGPLVMPGPGDTFQSYGRAWANVSNTPFREYKHWVHEGGISTPLIAHWPAGIAAQGELRQRPGHLVDIMATCLDVAGEKIPEGRLATEGESLVASFADANSRRERAIFWEHEGNRALRDGEWKLVAKGPAAPWELYRMTDDRTEQHNLASSEPERVKAMAARWETEARRMNVLPWIWKPQYGTHVEKTAESTEQPDFDDDARGSGAAKFSLKADADLTGDAAPRLVGKAFIITAEIIAPGSGVIVAQGGSSHGWSLHTAADGKLRFSIRQNNKLTTAEGPALSAGTLVTTLAADGTVTFTQGGTNAKGKVAGPLVKHPADGLQVGRDNGGRVGDYKDDAAFSGKLGSVTVERK